MQSRLMGFILGLELLSFIHSTLSMPRSEVISKREVTWEPPPLPTPTGIVFLFHGKFVSSLGVYIPHPAQSQK
jgi:hypothetical protein